jgi:hypothetical protein
MTILQTVMVLVILYCALRVPGRPDRVRERARRPRR